MSIKRVALYSRTSTSDKQSPELQVHELKEYAALRGWEVVATYTDHGFTGTNTNRPRFRDLMTDSRQRRFDAVVVWKLDRWARSLREILLTLQELADLGVEFISLKDHLDLSTSQGKLMMHILAAFGQFEADIIRMRVLAGLDHAKAKGVRLGRPKKHNPTAIAELRAKGLSYTQIQEQLQVSKGAVCHALRSTPKPPSQSTPKNSINSRGGRE